MRHRRDYLSLGRPKPPCKKEPSETQTRIEKICSLVETKLQDHKYRTALLAEIKAIGQTLENDLNKKRIEEQAVTGVLDSLKSAINSAAERNQLEAKQHIKAAATACKYNATMKPRWAVVGMIIGAIVEAATLAIILAATHGLASLPLAVWAANIGSASLAGGLAGWALGKRHQSKAKDKVHKCGSLLFPEKTEGRKQKTTTTEISGGLYNFYVGSGPYEVVTHF